MHLHFRLSLLLDSAECWHTVLLLQFFARMDQLGQKALELRSGVDQAVQNERFEEAAMLQEQIDKLSEEDDVNMVMNVRRAAARGAALSWAVAPRRLGSQDHARQEALPGQLCGHGKRCHLDREGQLHRWCLCHLQWPGSLSLAKVWWCGQVCRTWGRQHGLSWCNLVQLQCPVLLPRRLDG